ncbi:MAG: phosphate ABC transporter permease subunit PstC [Rhodobacteraceae bacterium]|nr:MAG: phosphate ABC transporter permease subunit PstC [Paracoccaceae bacterium]
MAVFWLIGIVLALAAAGLVLGRARALACVGGDARGLHSRPVYHGWTVAVAVLGPVGLVLTFWLLVQPLYVGAVVSAMLGDSADPRGLLLAEVRRAAEGLEAAVETGVIPAALAEDARADAAEITRRLKAAGQVVTSDLTAPVLRAAQRTLALNASGDRAMAGVVLAVALAGLVLALRRIAPAFRARPVVERDLRALLIAAASIAVLTTLGIVLSLVFNTVGFFRLYPAAEFFTGLDWAPSFSGRGGASDLGVLPLLWGTLYISVVALAVAVPIGLFAAIYLSEYAAPRFRALAKPLLEVLAGIPTIVYGLFALLTVGPLLMRVFGEAGLGWMQSGTAVITAGLVMGIMLIPFVSSLSDDIISAVPQALRDGSYGLGATRSETIRQVVLPAALPGIVGAILLAASRAIGETMIVVLGAGAAARLSLNPFEAMTTVTAKIVSQLTGDADFASPEALVAFALGMTLFVLTLGLNVVALVIVRRYREHYE